MSRARLKRGDRFCARAHSGGRRRPGGPLPLEGYGVGTGSSGGQALEALAQAPPDALILDLGLPDLDGLTVCRRMRSAGDDTPVLMLTARDAVDDRVQG